MGQFDLIECPRCQVIRIANNLSSGAQRALPRRGHFELRREDNKRTSIGPLDHESILVDFKNEAMELFFTDDFTF